MNELIIKNGLVHKGDGSGPEEFDVLVRGDAIVGFAKPGRKYGKNIIDAKGMVVTPGFIEINFDAGEEGGIFDDIFSTRLIRKGITTAIAGGNGLSLAPIFFGTTAFLRDRYSLRWNVNWQSVRELLSALEKRGVGINFGTLVGYATLRSAFMEGFGRDLTIGETESAGRVLSQSIREGAFGAAFDLSEPYLSGVNRQEILRVLNAAGRFRNVFTFHLRDERKVKESLAEIYDIAAAHNLNAEINHFQPLEEVRYEYLKAAKDIEENAAEKHLHFDVFPEPVIKMAAHDFLPPWIASGVLKDVLAAAKTRHLQERIIAYLDTLNLENIVVASMPKPLRFLEGKRLADVAASQELSLGKTLFQLAILSRMRGGFFSPSVSDEALKELMKSKHALLSAHYHRAEEENASLFPTILSSESSVEKITALPARKYGITRRGMIKEGYFADINVFKGGKPWYVVVNGRIIMEGGMVRPQFAGRVLKSVAEK